MKEFPDVIGLKLNEGQALLETHGFGLGDVKLALAPNKTDSGQYRIVKQLLGLNNRVELVVVSELPSFTGSTRG